MGKIRGKQPSRHTNHHDSPIRAKKTIARRQHSQNGVKHGKSKSSITSKIQPKPRSIHAEENHRSKRNTPFTEWDHVLLIGEGDLSFALSLVTHHDVGSVVATCFDSEKALEEKYPAVKSTIATLNSHCNGTATIGSTEDGSESWTGFSPVQSDDERMVNEQPSVDGERVNRTVLFDIDATKLSTLHKKVFRAHMPFTKIVFNFPHVGDLSKDVNRQVRSNQQLLVDFFKSAIPLLATTAKPAKITFTNDDNGKEDEDYDEQIDGQSQTSPREEYMKHGKILVTLFECEPYTLWNIRDLARHSGLKVLESFKFPWSVYPGYRYTRTAGDITIGKDKTDGKTRKGARRDETRDARCYVLALKDDDDGRPAPGSRKAKLQEDDSE